MVTGPIDAGGAGIGGVRLFARWQWEVVHPEALHLEGSDDVVSGYRRIDNITDEALRRWRTAYGASWTKDDVFL
jgi:hypothetical protein